VGEFDLAIGGLAGIQTELVLLLVDYFIARQTHGLVQGFITARLALQAGQQHPAKSMQAFQVSIVVGHQLG